MMPGTLVGGRYEVVDTLGEGGMAFVFRCRDTELRRTVAVKVIQDRMAHRPDLLARFQREMRVVASMSHPNVIAVFDHGVLDDGRPYFVMEYLPCPSLDDYLSDRSLEESEILALARSMAEGLRHVHERGVVHRDLKPANVLVPAKGVAKLVDFGLALVEDASRFTRAGAVIGTPRYLSPEQFSASSVDARSDIFQFGAIVQEMLTGGPAFPGERIEDIAAAVLNGCRAPIADEGRRLRWDGFLRRCLATTPAERFPSMATVLDGLEDVERSLSLPPPSPPAQTRTATTGSAVNPAGRPLRPAALCCVLLIAAGILLILRRPPDEGGVLGVRLSALDQAVIQHQPILAGRLALSFHPDPADAPPMPGRPADGAAGANGPGGTGATMMLFPTPVEAPGSFVVTDSRSGHTWRFPLSADEFIDRLLAPVDALSEDRFRDLVIAMVEERSTTGKLDDLSAAERIERISSAESGYLGRAGLSPSWVASMSAALPRLLTADVHAGSLLARRLFRVRVLENVAGHAQAVPMPWCSVSRLLRITTRYVHPAAEAGGQDLARVSFEPRPRWLAPRRLVEAQRASPPTNRMFWENLMDRLMQTYDPRPGDSPPSVSELLHEIDVVVSLPADALTTELVVRIDARLFTRTLFLEFRLGDGPPMAVFNTVPGILRDGSPTSGMSRNVIAIPVSPGSLVPGLNHVRIAVRDSPGDEASTALALYRVSVARRSGTDRAGG